MASMASEEFIQHPAYKFMFVLGIVDMITLPCNAIYFGMQTVLGLHYCNNPLVNYIVGGISMSRFDQTVKKLQTVKTFRWMVYSIGNVLRLSRGQILRNLFSAYRENLVRRKTRILLDCILYWIPFVLLDGVDASYIQ